jgi:hypothetical protein
LGTSRQPSLNQILALSHEQALALAMLALAQLADQLQLLVVGAGNHLVRFSLLVSSPGTPGLRQARIEHKKTGRKRPAREEVESG